MFGISYLVANKPLNGKPFTSCSISTGWVVTLSILRQTDAEAEKEQVPKMFDMFHDGIDDSEQECNISDVIALLKRSDVTYFVDVDAGKFVDLRKKPEPELIEYLESKKGITVDEVQTTF